MRVGWMDGWVGDRVMRRVRRVVVWREGGSEVAVELRGRDRMWMVVKKGR